MTVVIRREDLPRAAAVAGLALALMGLALALSACGTKLDNAKVTKAISDGINTQLSLPITSVDCTQAPPMVKAGTTFECSAQPEPGGKLTVKVTENDAAGNITWEVTKTEGLLNLQTIEQAVTKGLKEQTGTDATVSCGGRWRAAKAGDAFDCEAKAADGTASTVTVTATDDVGNITWKLQAAEAAEPAAEAPH